MPPARRSGGPAYGPVVASNTPTEQSLAQRLLDAQVAFHLRRWSEEELGTTIAALAETVLATSGERRIDALVDPQAIKDIVTRALTTVPGSAAVRELVEMAVDIVYDGPEEPYPVGDVVARERVEALLDRLLALTPLLERALDRVSDSPLVATVATRFMGRIVGEVLQANQAVAGKVPGLGSLMSFGTSAASKMMGAADKQFEALLGGTVGKGSTFAVRRLNGIIVETLRDPTTRDALLQVWDRLAQADVVGLADYATRAEVAGVVTATHDLVVDAAAHEQASQLAEAAVDGFVARFGDRTGTEFLDELELSSDDLVSDLVRLAPGVVGALRESGELERLLRAQLEPFYASAEVEALLEGAEG